jgi:hypothetical protein
MHLVSDRTWIELAATFQPPPPTQLIVIFVGTITYDE